MKATLLLLPALVLILCLSRSGQARPLRSKRWTSDRAVLAHNLEKALQILEQKRAQLTSDQSGPTSGNSLESDFYDWLHLQPESDVSDSDAGIGDYKEDIIDDDYTGRGDYDDMFSKNLENYLNSDVLSPSESVVAEDGFPLIQTPVDESELASILGDEEEEREEEEMRDEAFYNWLLNEYNKELDGAVSNYEVAIAKRNMDTAPFQEELQQYIALPRAVEEAQEEIELPSDDTVDELGEVENQALKETLDLMTAAQKNGYTAENDPNTGRELDRLNVAYDIEKLKNVIDEAVEDASTLEVPDSALALEDYPEYQGDYSDSIGKGSKDLPDANAASSGALLEVYNVLTQLPSDRLEDVEALIESIEDERAEDGLLR